jgi:hypothetical protein
MVSTGIEFLAMFSIFRWQDCAEIMLVSLGIYYGVIWLATDKQTALMFFFYGYISAAIACYHLGLTTLSLILIVLFPVITPIFFLIHAQTLQKNFVTLKKYTPQLLSTHKEWVPSFMRSSLLAINQGIPVYAVLEKNDALSPFLRCQVPIQAPVQQDLLELIMASPVYHPEAMVWLTTSGTIIGANTHWNYELDEAWLTRSVQALALWQQQALWLTAKTDALIFQIEPTTRLSTIIMQGKLIEHLRLEHAMTLLHRHIEIKTTYFPQGDSPHVSHTPQNYSTQRTP